MGDVSKFEESISKVQEFYKLSGYESASRNLIYGLHLMYLLASNRLAEFHMVCVYNRLNDVLMDSLLAARSACSLHERK